MAKKPRHKRISKKTGGRCWYCGKKEPLHHRTLDHQDPKASGGANDDSNLVIACRPCNREKGCLDVEAYRQLKLTSMPAGACVVFYGEQRV